MHHCSLELSLKRKDTFNRARLLSPLSRALLGQDTVILEILASKKVNQIDMLKLFGFFY